MHERLRGLDGLVTRDEREDSLERLFSPDKPFLESLPCRRGCSTPTGGAGRPGGRAAPGGHAGGGAPAVVGLAVGDDAGARVQRLVGGQDAVPRDVEAPTAVLRVGQVVRVRNRKNRGFKGPLGHWSPELYLIVSAAEDAVGPRRTRSPARSRCWGPPRSSTLESGLLLTPPPPSAAWRAS